MVLLLCSVSEYLSQTRRIPSLVCRNVDASLRDPWGRLCGSRCPWACACRHQSWGNRRCRSGYYRRREGCLTRCHANPNIKNNINVFLSVKPCSQGIWPLNVFPCQCEASSNLPLLVTVLVARAVRSSGASACVLVWVHGRGTKKPLVLDTR